MNTDVDAPPVRAKKPSLPDQTPDWFVKQAKKFNDTTSRAECEWYIRNAETSWILEAIALDHIEKQRLWGDSANDFEDYCWKFWQIKIRQVRYTIAAGKAAIEYFEWCTNGASKPVDLPVRTWREVGQFSYHKRLELLQQIAAAGDDRRAQRVRAWKLIKAEKPKTEKKKKTVPNVVHVPTPQRAPESNPGASDGHPDEEVAEVTKGKDDEYFKDVENNWGDEFEDAIKDVLLEFLEHGASPDRLLQIASKRMQEIMDANTRTDL